MREAGGSAASRRRAAAALVYGLLTIGTWVLLAPQTELNQHQGMGWWVAGALVPVFLVAALLLAQLPGHGVARVVAAMACANATVLAAGVAAEWLAQHQLSGAEAIRWVAAVSWAGTLPLVPVLMLVFPTGGPPSRRWRPVLWAQLATVAVLAVLSAIGEGEVPHGLEPLAALSGVVLLGSGVLAVVRRVAG